MLNHPCFLRWRDDDESNLLWISADPGCGKSTLSKALVDDDILHDPTDSRHAFRIYFFFKDLGEQSLASSAICALIHQLYSVPSIWELCRKYAQKIIDSQGESIKNDLPGLWNMLLESVKLAKSIPIICVLDALDECQEKERRQLIEKLQDYALAITTLPLKFLVTSRPYHHIVYDFQYVVNKVPTIHLAGEEESDSIKQEIDLVIVSKIGEIGDRMLLTMKVQKRLAEKLKSMEHRTYLWLSFIWEEIRQLAGPTEEELLNQIEALPSSVEEAYNNILQKSPDRRVAEEILSLVAIAFRPLNLEELEQLLQVKQSTKSTRDLKSRGAHRFKQYARSICGLFLMVVDARVYLIHQTAKEFLLKGPQFCVKTTLDWKGCVDPPKAHDLMSARCMVVLLAECCDNSDDTSTVFPPTDSYLLEHGFMHIAKCEHELNAISIDIFKELAVEIDLTSQFGKYLCRATLSADRCNEVMSLVEQQSLLKDLNDREAPVFGNAKALVLATAYGYPQISESLWRHLGTSSENRAYVQSCMEVSLRLVVMNSWEGMVDSILYAYPPTINSRCSTRRNFTPLDCAIAVSHGFGCRRALDAEDSWKIVFLLVRYGATVTDVSQPTLNRCFSRRLSALSESSSLDEIRTMLSAGFDPSQGFLLSMAKHWPAQFLAELFSREDLAYNNWNMGASKHNRCGHGKDYWAPATNQCGSPIDHLITLVLRSFENRQIDTAETVLKALTRLEPSVTGLCGLCVLLTCCKPAVERMFESDNSFLSFVAMLRSVRHEQCIGLGPMVIAAFISDTIAIQQLLLQHDYWDNNVHGPISPVSLSWAAFLAVMRDDVAVLRYLRQYRSLRSTNTIASWVSDDIIKACICRQSEILASNNVLPKKLEAVQAAKLLLAWTLSSLATLLKHTSAKLIPQYLFRMSSAEKFLWCFCDDRDIEYFEVWTADLEQLSRAKPTVTMYMHELRNICDCLTTGVSEDDWNNQMRSLDVSTQEHTRAHFDHRHHDLITYLLTSIFRT